LKLTPEELSEREVVFLDIAYDEVSSKHYKEEEVSVHLLIVSTV